MTPIPNKFRAFGCKEDEWKVLYPESKRFRVLLAKVLEADLNVAQDIVESDYDSPSWVNKQAHLNGKREVIKEILKLIK